MSDIIDLDDDPKEADWIKQVYADIYVTATDVVGLPAAKGVAIRDREEGPQIIPQPFNDPERVKESKTFRQGWLRRIFHLPGKHDQSSHGRKDKAGTIGKPKVLPWRDPPPGKRQGPFDVKCCNGEMEFEVKALTTDSAEYKIKMKKGELAGKKAAAIKKGVKAGSLMVIMDYKKGEAHAYWKEGLGNFRLNKTWNYAGTAELGEAA